MAMADRVSQRKAMTNSPLTTRQRRAWVTTLLNGVEKVETSYADLDKDILKAHEAGMSWAAIGGVLGMHATSVKELAERAESGNEGGS